MYNKISENYNSGNQFFQENNYYNNPHHTININSLVEKPKKLCSIIIPIIVEIIALIADLISIYSFYIEIESENLVNMIMDYSVFKYLLPVIFITFFLFAFGQNNIYAHS